mmetsp:Transcript_35754/g.43160  ORF Transcript_35754/g.43160 Transcript_35754/m.43160 type:complete len:124 (+) Transcript_35754:128-499(+)|eukprot:CAMPEP_0197862566 /NCGR_PEP_ID=MMETSP1438-20131217/39433_1 /TAXON_ID=1461541 /ORGANISM="Pterosperma sp., Strain CCMP1384" /LENGTH=123 /DNA_ID=CAMNT_0043480169 /DNA_START=111 /DNA_END=482 /DNA_ORIENTATION=-
MTFTGGSESAARDEQTLKNFESRVDPNNKDQMSLLEEMKSHTKKLSELRQNEDPRLSFATPEFRESQRLFTEGFKKNFNKPIEYGLVKKYPWSVPVLEKLQVPVDHKGEPWPLDDNGKPILKN